MIGCPSGSLAKSEVKPGSGGWRCIVGAPGNLRASFGLGTCIKAVMPFKEIRASLVVQLVKNPPDSAGDTRAVGSTSGSRQSPGEGKGNSILAWKIPWAEEPGGPQFTGSQTVRRSWACMHALLPAAWSPHSHEQGITVWFSRLPFHVLICSSSHFLELAPSRNPNPGKIIGQLTPFQDHMYPCLHLICSPGRNWDLGRRCKMPAVPFSSTFCAHVAQGSRWPAPSPRLLRSSGGGTHGASPLHFMPSQDSRDRLPIRSLDWSLLVARAPGQLPANVLGLQELQLDQNSLHYDSCVLFIFWVFSHSAYFSKARSYFQYRFWRVDTMV